MSGGEHRAPDSTNVYAVAVIGGVSTFLVWATIVALRAYFGNTGGVLAHEREVAGQEAVRKELTAKQMAQLEPKGLEYSDEKKTRVRIPIELAKEKVVETLQSNPQATTVPVVGEHNVANIPAISGRPDDNPGMGQTPPATDETAAPDSAPPAADEAAAPAGGAAPAPTDAPPAAPDTAPAAAPAATPAAAPSANEGAVTP